MYDAIFCFNGSCPNWCRQFSNCARRARRANSSWGSWRAALLTIPSKKRARPIWKKTFAAGEVSRSSAFSNLEKPSRPFSYLPGSLLRSSDPGKYENGLEGFSRLENALDRDTSPAAKVFFQMGRARFLLGIVRRAALQLPQEEFARLARRAQLENCRHQFGQLPLKQKIASYIYLTSKRLFYYVARAVFKD